MTVNHSIPSLENTDPSVNLEPKKHMSRSLLVSVLLGLSLRES